MRISSSGQLTWTPVAVWVLCPSSSKLENAPHHDAAGGVVPAEGERAEAEVVHSRSPTSCQWNCQLPHFLFQLHFQGHLGGCGLSCVQIAARMLRNPRIHGGDDQFDRRPVSILLQRGTTTGNNELTS